MIETADELRSALAATPLADREIVEVDVPAESHDEGADGGRVGSGRTDGSRRVLAMRIEPTEVLAAWQEGRQVLDRTGRWPLATCSWDIGRGHTRDLASIAEVLGRLEFAWERAGSADPAAILDRARAVHIEDELAALAREATWLDDPVTDEVAEPVVGYLDWFEPTAQLVALLWLPVGAPEEALAYVHWFAGSEQLPSHVLVALLRSWRLRFGAELVAHWGTMLQLVVRRPPADLGEALALAREQELVAPCTTSLPGVSTAAHAATLMTSSRWFLHERP